MREDLGYRVLDAVTLRVDPDRFASTPDVLSYMSFPRGMAGRVNFLPQHHTHMESRVDVTVPMEEELKDELDQHLGYGDSRAEWIREAIRMRLNDQVKIEVEMSDELKTQINAAVLTSEESRQEWIERAASEKLEDTSD